MEPWWLGENVGGLAGTQLRRAKYVMRYYELMREGDSSATERATRATWKATQKKHDALRRLRDKEADAAATRARAQPDQPHSDAPKACASKKLADARRTYARDVSTANDSIRTALKRGRD